MTSYIDITRIVDEPAQHYAFSRDGQHFSFDKDIMQIVTFHRNTPIGRRVKFDEDIEKILKRFNRIKTRQYTTYSTSEMIARCEKHRSTNVSSNSHDEPSRTSKSRQQHSPQTRALQALSKTSNLRAHNVAALLRGNICNAPAMTEAVLLLNGQQMFQHSIALGTTFLKRCSSSYSIAFPVAYAMYHSSRLEDAARLLREYEPVKRDNSQYYTWRGFVDERLGRHTTAARHFLKALTLFPDLKNVHVQQFYYATRALEAAGKPCEAMHPLQMYVALEPAKRMTGQIRSILNRLRQRGRC